MIEDGRAGRTATESRGQRMHDLAAELFPITRSLIGPGFRETLDMLEGVCGSFERHRFATGERVFDWVIPPEWTIRDAWIKTADGNTVVSLERSNLHVVSHSCPVRASLTLDELQPHLHSLPEQPDAVPYRTSYYRASWGFCLSDRVRRSLPPGRYDVLIDADLAPGRLELAELTIDGESGAEVLFATYCCHPSMANNELSGPVLCAHLAALLRQRRERPRLTYKFLFAPETIGAIAYLSRFGERLRRSLIAGYVVTCVGDPGPFTYKRSRRGDSLADRVAEHVLAHSGHPSRMVDFVPSGSDERQYCSPGFDLPVGSMMRSMYGTYPEYHTSLDDLSLVTPQALGESLETYRRIVDTLEGNETLACTMPYCEPQLSSRGLYPTTGGGLANQQQVHDMNWMLNLCDGSVDLLAVAQRAGRPLWELRPMAETLVEHGLLRRHCRRSRATRSRRARARPASAAGTASAAGPPAPSRTRPAARRPPQ
jgi:aminopeptidase-like protein